MNFAELIWGGFNGSYALPEDEIHVWRTTLDMEPSGFTKLQQILSPDERGRANRFHFEVDRRRGVIGRGYLRLLLGRILDLPANKLQFEYDEFGKPSLIPKQRLPLQFNVSHSGGMILIAITIGREVGVDVERIRTDLDPVIIAARFFSAIEYKILTSLAGPARCLSFPKSNHGCWQLDPILPRHDGGGSRRWTCRAIMRPLWQPQVRPGSSNAGIGIRFY